MLLAENIVRLRKQFGLTQEQLAAQVGVTFQSVSKWETGQTLPDVVLLPKLAGIFEVSIDALLGYLPSQNKISEYETKYLQQEYYWGTAPSEMCYEVMKLKPPVRPWTVLDIGCGEGKDAVFFARNGYTVSAFDIADEGLSKAKQLAAANNVEINFFKANLWDYRLQSDFDIIFSSGVFHYIKPELRNELLGNYREHTKNEGVCALNVFVQKPFIAPPPDGEPSDTIWRSGELCGHFSGWYFHRSEQIIFDCGSSGIPHRHCMDVLIAQKLVK